MSLLAAPALLLLIAVPLLVWFALQRREPSRVEVGTLMLWRRVVRNQPAATQTRRRVEPLLWILLAAVVVGAFGAARPGVFAPAETPRVAVFIERAGAGANEPQLAQVLARAQALAPEAELEFYMPATQRPEGAPDGLIMLSPGRIEAEIAQFEARTTHADARMLMLCQPHRAAGRVGMVVNRLSSPTAGVLYHAAVQDDVVVTRASGGAGLRVEGAMLVGEAQAGADMIRRYRVEGDGATLTDAHGNAIRVSRQRLIVGVGPDWSTQQHRALFAALRAESADGGQPAVWLGSRDAQPAIRIDAGTLVAPDEVEVSYAAAHPLFQDLPLGSFDWAAAGSLLPPDSGNRALVSAVRNGASVGDYVAYDEVRRVLYFSGDPFSAAPVADAALLLDNAIGEITGERPSQRARYAIEGELPTERAAHAAPFETQGSLETGNRNEPVEYATWLLALAACAAVAATFLVARKA